MEKGVGRSTFMVMVIALPPPIFLFLLKVPRRIVMPLVMMVVMRPRLRFLPCVSRRGIVMIILGSRLLMIIVSLMSLWRMFLES